MTEASSPGDAPPPARPPYIVAALLVALALWMALYGFPRSPVYGWVTAAVLLAAAVGAVLRRRWGRWLVFACAAFAWVAWWWIIIRLALTGWPVAGGRATVIALIPGVAWLVFWAAIAFAVRRPFRR